MSDERYEDWIRAEVPADPIGLCAAITATMAEEFPELRRVRGHYHCPMWGRRAHWWLVAPDGRVVDPTVAQFPSRGTGEYEPWPEGAPEPTGKCLNCGEYTYGGRSACTDECEAALVAEYAGYRSAAKPQRPKGA